MAAHAAAVGLQSYVFIPADLEEQKILATGVYGTHVVAVDGTYDDEGIMLNLSGVTDIQASERDVSAVKGEERLTRRHQVRGDAVPAVSRETQVGRA